MSGKRRKRYGKQTRAYKRECNTRVRDNGAKLISHEIRFCVPSFCGAIRIFGLLKDVQPEDIEDLPERFFPCGRKGETPILSNGCG